MCIVYVRTYPVHICVCIYVRMYVCIYVCMYVYVRMYVRMYVRTYVRIYACVYVRTYVCTCICAYAWHTYIRTYTQLRIRTYVCTYFHPQTDINTIQSTNYTEVLSFVSDVTVLLYLLLSWLDELKVLIIIICIY